MKSPQLSIITPAYNEAKNLPALHERLDAAMAKLGMSWEWIVVDDHSSDDSVAVLRQLSARDPRVRVFRLAKNSGSHKAIFCGLDFARGAAAVLMAADLQDPPETVPQLVDEWSSGAQVVWAVREGREGESRSTLGFAGLYYFMMRHISGTSQMPATGADFFLIDRVVIDGLRQFHESNTSIFALITWMGFRQSSISYVKSARLHGASGWTFRKKVKLVVDSVTSFTYFPIRFMSYFGMTVAVLGFVYALLILTRAFNGERPAGWASLMVISLILGGSQMAMLGVLGQYLWRALEESRRRPRYLIEWESDSAPKTLNSTRVHRQCGESA